MEKNFPYDADDFEDVENKKIARMMRWMYFQLNRQICDNQETIDEHESDIYELKKKLRAKKNISDYQSEVRTLVLKVSVSVAVITGTIIGFIQLFI